MGISVFIKRMDSKQDLLDAIKLINLHDQEEFEDMFPPYTDQEKRLGDPMRWKFNQDLIQSIPELANQPKHFFLPRQNRGADIGSEGCLVYFQGSLWLEVTNVMGGLNSTKWLQRNSSGWIGTEGKPDGFQEAKMVDEGDLHALYDRFEKLQLAYRII